MMIIDNNDNTIIEIFMSKLLDRNGQSDFLKFHNLYAYFSNFHWQLKPVFLVP